MSPLQDTSVELSVTVWERTWRTALTPEFFARIREEVFREFDVVSVTVNNVDDPSLVRTRLQQLRASGIVHSTVDVGSALPAALTRTGLTMGRLRPLEHYSDHFLVKVCQPGPRYLVHWDTDVRLTRPGDWVTPGIEYLRTHPGVKVVTPAWSDKLSLDRERLSTDGPFDLGYGFSDQIFLADRTSLAAPIYRRIAPAAWWYPTSHIAPIFEQRVDAWMRRGHLLRATYRPVQYAHEEVMVSHPSRTLVHRVRHRAQATTVAALEHLPGFIPAIHRRPRRAAALPESASHGMHH